MFKLIDPIQKITQNLNKKMRLIGEGNRKNNGRVFTDTDLRNYE